MRAVQVAGQWIIDHDEEVLRMVYTYDANGAITGTVNQDGDGRTPIDLDADYQEYLIFRTVDNGPRLSDGTRLRDEWCKVDVRDYKPDLATLATIYETAMKTKRPEWAAAYVKHKNRILALFN